MTKPIYLRCLQEPDSSDPTLPLPEVADMDVEQRRRCVGEWLQAGCRQLIMIVMMIMIVIQCPWNNMAHLFSVMKHRT